MKASQGFTWTQADNHIPQAQEALMDSILQVVTKGVMDIQGNAVADAPVKGGLLKGSVQAILPDPGWGGGGAIAGGVGTNIEYGPYVELGTGSRGAASSYPYPRSARYTSSWPGMAARAFMGNAAKRVEPAFLGAMATLGSRMPRKV